MRGHLTDKKITNKIFEEKKIYNEKKNSRYIGPPCLIHLSVIYNLALITCSGKIQTISKIFKMKYQISDLKIFYLEPIFFQIKIHHFVDLSKLPKVCWHQIHVTLCLHPLKIETKKNLKKKIVNNFYIGIFCDPPNMMHLSVPYNLALSICSGKIQTLSKIFKMNFFI